MSLIDYTEKEKRIFEKLNSELDKCLLKKSLSMQERLDLEYTLFKKYFGFKKKKDDSQKLTNLRFGYFKMLYDKEKKSKGIQNLKMEIWCKQWEQYTVELNKESMWLYDQVRSHTLSDEDIRNGNYTLPDCINPVAPDYPPCNFS